MSELEVLRALLLVSVIVAPLGTRLLGELPSGWHVAHGVSVAAVGLGLFVLPWASTLWPVFCAANLAVFLWSRRRTLLTLPALAGGVPLAFSLVAATWIVGGTNDLGILGYGPHFSFYAALHGNVLGWMLVGAIAALATREGPRQRLYAITVFVCFVSFLLVAIGIDQVRAIKPVGVAGLTLAIPLAQLAFLAEVRSHRAAFAAGLVSFLGLVFTLVLAWQNELAAPTLGNVAGVRSMVSVHGVVNALVTAPAMMLAVYLRDRR